MSLDFVQQAQPWSVTVVGLLDEPAHLATAWVALAALAPRHTPDAIWWAAIFACVAIDIDHVPLYLTDGAFAVAGGRPPTHSLVVVALLVVLSAVPQMRWLIGAAVGVLLHLLRDVATGPGVPLLWPYSDISTRCPYWTYLVALAFLAKVRCSRTVKAT
ncbi:inner membrane protein [Geodermatophilus bullaregiensis]|nr:inner membrane protein [Geodermatophilus bullaregiensis]